MVVLSLPVSGQFKQTYRNLTNELSKQNTSGVPKTIRDNVILTLGNMLEQAEFFSELFDKARTVLHRLQCIERYVREIKTETKNLSIKL